MRKRDPSGPVNEQEQVPHDSQEDASVALALVLEELQRGTPCPPLQAPQVKVGTCRQYHLVGAQPLASMPPAAACAQVSVLTDAM